ncbi:MAG: acyloxyacyl hydrolase [Syntrophorhabdus sp.]
MPIHTYIATTSRIVSLIMAILILFLGESIYAQDNPRPEAPGRLGLAVGAGRSFTPNSEMTFLNLTGLAMIDFQRVWPGKTPENIRLKAEFSPGVITHPNTRAIISSQVLVVVYFRSLSTALFSPYLEFGAGGIYTDYRVEGQDSRFNFLLTGGPGIQFMSGPLKDYFASLRYHHISNGGFCNRNKALDSLFFSVGYLF